MQIRRNTKEFKAIRNVLIHFYDDPKRNKIIQLYAVKSGHTVQDKVLLDGENDIFYDMAYDTVVNNLENGSSQLQKDDDNPGLFYFHSSNNKVWDEAPFTIDESILSKLSEYEKVEARKKKPAAKRKVEKPQTPTLLKNKVDIGSKKVLDRDQIKKKTEDIPVVKMDNTRVSSLKKNIVPKPKPLFDDVHESLIFHDTDKIIFKEAKISKLEILQYYNKVYKLILPFVQNRFQDFRWHASKNIADTTVCKDVGCFEKKSGTVIPDWYDGHVVNNKLKYFQIRDKTDLLLMAELGCIEIYPWHSRATNLPNPDYAIIELLGLEFSLVIETALILKDILAHLDIPGFAKIAGNNNLHIYIPLDSKATYEMAFELSRFICRLVHLKAPFKTTLEISDENDELVLLNHHLNVYGQTVSAPFSIIADTNASIAMPLEWEDIHEDLDLDGYTVKSVLKNPELTAKPFESMMKKGIDVKKVLEKLEKTYGFLL